MAVGHAPRRRRDDARRARSAAPRSSCCAPIPSCGSRPTPGAVVHAATRRGARRRRCSSTRCASRSRSASTSRGEPVLRRLHLHERRAGRPRVDLGHHRRRDEDVLRALPALHDLRDRGRAGRCSARTPRTTRARLQRQGRGPAPPRPPQPRCSPTTQRAHWARSASPTRSRSGRSTLRPAAAPGGDETGSSSRTSQSRAQRRGGDLRLDAGGVHPPGSAALLLHRDATTAAPRSASSSRSSAPSSPARRTRWRTSQAQSCRRRARTPARAPSSGSSRGARRRSRRRRAGRPRLLRPPRLPRRLLDPDVGDHSWTGAHAAGDAAWRSCAG